MGSPKYRYPTHEEWFAGLSEEGKQRTVALIQKLKALGAADPERWARSEVSEGIAQLTRFLIIQRIWSREVAPWSDEPKCWLDEFARYATPRTSKIFKPRPPLPLFGDAAAAINRLREAGASEEDLGLVARLVAYSVAFGVVNLIDEGRLNDSEDHLPGWKLMETNSEGTETGRDVGGLHESLLGMHEDSLKSDQTS
jgi:hypothetical protein